MIRWLLLCLLGGTGLYAQLRQPSFLQTTTDNGLPANEVYSVLQDRYGMIWLGTDAGLVKHCGAYFKVLRNAGQRSAELTGLVAGRSGRVYGYNFNKQLFFAENDSLHLLRNFTCNVSSTIADTAGFLWVTTDSGMFRYQESTARWENLFSPAQGELAKNGCLDARQHVWCCEGDYVTEYWPIGKKKYPVDMPEGQILVLGNYCLVPSGGDVWMLGLLNGLFLRLREGVFQPFESAFLSRALRGRKITFARAAPDGWIWVLTHSGAIHWHPATDSGEEIFPHLAISDVLLDREGNHWFSTLGSGIVQVPDLQSTILRDGAGSNEGRITQLLWHQNALYFGTQTGVLGRISPGSPAKTWNTGVKTRFYCLKTDPGSGEMVAATTSQVFRLRQDQLSPPVGPFPPIKDLLIVDKGYVIASSFGVYHWKTRQVSGKNTKYALPWATQLLWQHASARLWAATHDGLHVVRVQSDTLLPDTVLFGGSRVMFVAGDTTRSDAWAVTADGTVWAVNAQLQPHEIHQFHPDIQLHQLLYQQYILYLATNRGVFLYDTRTGHWDNLSTPDGLWPEDVLAIAPGADQLYVSAGDRLHAFPLLRDHRTRPPTLVHVAGVFLAGKRVQTTDFLEVGYRQTLAVEVQASAYASLADFQYAWRLAGDSAWRFYPAGTRQIALSGLPAGDFALEIKVVDHLGRDSANRVLLRGRMIPPFWQRWWFYFLIGLAVLAGAWLVFRQREAALKKKQRTEIQRLELEHSLRMSQQTAIAAQMNPHFIFNVLNAIKSYIYENDKKQALKYLTDFSVLMREVLQMSGLPRVSLAQELRMLGLYTQLESMLCEGGVTCEISVDPALNPELCMIPSMLLQPLVENAFRHGLRHRVGEKRLVIRVVGPPPLPPSPPLHSEGESEGERGPGGEVSLIVEDNGIGRSASAALNQSRHSGHQSFATGAIQKRIDLLNFERPDAVVLTTEDLFAPDGSPAGTRVTLTLHDHA